MTVLEDLLRIGSGEECAGARETGGKLLVERGWEVEEVGMEEVDGGGDGESA